MKPNHWKSARLAAALAMLALAGTADAREVEGWNVLPQDDTCFMSSAFEDDVTLAVIWNPATRDLAFMAAGNALRGLRGSNGKQVSFDLAFGGRTRPGSWTDDTAVVIETDGGAVGVIAKWSDGQSSELADAIAAASGVSITVGDMDLGAFALTGIPAAYRELMRCGDTLAAGGKS